MFSCSLFFLQKKPPFPFPCELLCLIPPASYSHHHTILLFPALPSSLISQSQPLFLITYSNASSLNHLNNAPFKNPTLVFPSFSADLNHPGSKRKTAFWFLGLALRLIGYPETHSFCGRRRWGPVPARPRPHRRRRLRGVSGRVDLRDTEVSHRIVWEPRLDLVALIVTTR